MFYISSLVICVLIWYICWSCISDSETQYPIPKWLVLITLLLNILPGLNIVAAICYIILTIMFCSQNKLKGSNIITKFFKYLNTPV